MAADTHAEPSFLVGWGSNAYGRLGTGDMDARDFPVLCGGLEHETEGLAAVALGAAHVLCLGTSGALYTHGKCHYGQLGHGELDQDVLLPTPVTGLPGPPRHVALLAAGESACFVVYDDGSVYVWGCGFYGALGTGSEAHVLVPALAPALGAFGGVQLLASGGAHTLVLCGDGVLRACGSNAWGQCGFGVGGPKQSLELRPVPLPHATSCAVHALAASRRNTLVLTRDGRVLVCGEGAHGCLGTGAASADAHALQALALPEPVLAIAAGTKHCIAASATTLYSWGTSAYGRLGRGREHAAAYAVGGPAPVHCQLTGPWRAVSAGVSHALALASDGTLVGWGSGLAGKHAPRGSCDNRYEAAPIDLCGAAATWAACGSNHSFCRLQQQQQQQQQQLRKRP